MTHPNMRSTALLAAIAFAAIPAFAAAQPRNPMEPPPLAPVVEGNGAKAPPAQPSAVLPDAASAAIGAASKPSPSRWRATLDRLDTDLRLRLLAPSDPRGHWLAAQFDLTDIESKVKNLASARVDAPDNRLYLASLAFACMQPTRPQLPACAAVDRLADWAIRDAANGVPTFLLGFRALERGQADAAVAYVDEAAAAPRYDDYWSEGPQQWWGYLRPLAIDIDPVAKAKAAATYALEHDLGWTRALHLLCADPGGRSEPMRVACAKLGTAMGERAATFALRRAGARIAEIDAADARSRAAARVQSARILEASARCTLAEPDFETAFESPDSRVRTRGVDEFDAWVSAQAKDGEAAACERVVAAARRR
ncbi:MAG: hypothetical protein KGR23_15200 [Betaproteobacteria bacterium]|nr:hypothetical protein [Betaproteobacteria bacterium]